MGKPDLKRFTTWKTPPISPQRGPRAWSGPVTPEEASRRAGARRRWNLERRHRADARRAKLSPHEHDPWRNGAELARMLGVHRSTVCRDFKILADQRIEAIAGRCNLKNLIKAIRKVRRLRMARGASI